MSEMQCVIVTPERTEVDVRATSVVLPLFDGEMGILSGHSPLVGRLGYGELRIKLADGVASRYFVEGGFVQVSGDVVSVLTDRLSDCTKIDRQSAEKALDAALSIPATKENAVARDRATSRARAMMRLVERK